MISEKTWGLQLIVWKSLKFWKKLAQPKNWWKKLVWPIYSSSSMISEKKPGVSGRLIINRGNLGKSFGKSWQNQLFSPFVLCNLVANVGQVKFSLSALKFNRGHGDKLQG